MFSDDENKPLSKADQALWEKVTKTIAPPKSGRKSDMASKARVKKDDKRTNKAAPTTEDFAALLDGQTPVKRPKKQTTVKRITENPAAPEKPKAFRAKTQPPKPKKQVATLQKREVRNITSGKNVIEAAIDLHGLTAREAETALITFLKRAQTDNKRLALVITGKGQRRPSEERAFELGAPEPGILRREVPGWLNALPDLVQSHSPAHKKHGGDGALYVRLRRKKI